MSQPHILLTGGTGFLGSHLLVALLANGFSVTVVKRSTSNVERIANSLSQITVLDSDAANFAEALNQTSADIVIHTATNYGRSKDSVNSIFAANTAFPLQLLEWAANKKIKAFINTDTVLPANINAYALSKAQFVAWGQYFAQQYRLSFINVKLEHMFGAGDDVSKFTTYIIESCRQHVPEIKLTQGEQQRDFIYIDDVVSGYLTLLANTKSDGGFSEYALGSGQTVTIREFAELVHQLTHSRSQLLFGAIPYRGNEMMCSVADTSKLRSLGWQRQYNLAQGIQETLKGS